MAEYRNSVCGWKQFAVAAVTATIAVAGFVVVVGLHLGGASIVIGVDDIGEAVAAMLAAGACAWTANRSVGRFRRGWSLLAASAAAWGAGEVIWSVYEVGLGQTVPFPSAADVGFLAAVPLAIAGVLAFWASPRGTASRWRVWLDGAIIVTSLTFTGWVMGLRDVYLSAENSAWERSISMAYPIGDILIGAVLILAIRRASHFEVGQLLLLLGGLAANSIADSAFAYLTATDAYGAIGNVLDTGWVVGYLMIALAALWPAKPRDQAAERAPIDLWQLALPWVAVLTVAGSALLIGVGVRRGDMLVDLLGAVLGVLLIMSLVLTQRESLAMLIKSRTSEETLARVIEAAPVGIGRVSTDLKTIDANAALAALFLDTRESMIGSTFEKYLTPETKAEVLERYTTLIEGGADAYQADGPRIRADGTRIWVHWSATAVKNQSGEVDYLVIMIQDITARREAEEAAMNNLAVLERLDHVKNAFIQSVSHEFKTALIGIQGFSEFIRDSDDLAAKDVRSLASDIYKSADRLDQMVDEMVELDQTETTHMRIKVEPVDLNAIIEREAEGMRGGLDGVTLTTDLRRPLPIVAADKDKLAEVVRTLLHNAGKYTPVGSHISIASSASLGEVMVSVRDEGIGVRADFDNPLFGQEDLYANSPIRKVVGIGLGLGIARQIVEMHGGRIWVQRLEGGSQFHFTIPVAPARLQTFAIGGQVA